MGRVEQTAGSHYNHDMCVCNCAYGFVQLKMRKCGSKLCVDNPPSWLKLWISSTVSRFV